MEKYPKRTVFFYFEYFLIKLVIFWYYIIKIIKVYLIFFWYIMLDYFKTTFYYNKHIQGGKMKNILKYGAIALLGFL